MKQQPGRMQPTLFNPLGFNPFSMWTDIALKTGEIMLASAHAVERTAKSTEFVEGNGAHRRRTKSNGSGNGKAKRSAKRRSRK